MDTNLIYKILILLLLGVVIYFPLPITSQVCTETVKVSECLSDSSEYEKHALEKCSKACGNSEGDMKYKYHCMWDSTHKDLLEMCAIPKYLFGYCPAYDPKGQRIQKDESRPCKTSSSRTFYNSDELFFCDLTNCQDSFTSTTSDSSSGTTDMTTTQMTDWESWYLHLIWIAIVVIGLIIGLIIFLMWRQQSSAGSSNCFQICTPDCWKRQEKKNEEIDGVANGHSLLQNGV